jgi:hypothetical protein
MDLQNDVMIQIIVRRLRDGREFNVRVSKRITVVRLVEKARDLFEESVGRLWFKEAELSQESELWVWGIQNGSILWLLDPPAWPPRGADFYRLY